MRISFINSCLGGDFSALDIAITSLATYVNERTDHEARIIDLTFRRKQWRSFLRDRVEAQQPDVIGISCNTMYMQYVTKIAQEIKKNFSLPVILGGHHASMYPERTIEIPECDALCVGDGEEPLTAYLDAESDGRVCEGINGIWKKKNGKIVKNAGGRFRANLDDLPIPNWDLWEDLDKYFYHLGMLYMIGSRGCPYRCIFCDAHGIANAVGGEYFRMRDARVYVEEIVCQWKKYKNRNLRLVQLFDPVFTMNDEWVRTFCEAYRAQGLHKELPFSVFSRIDHLTEEKIRLLAEARCAVIRVGVESGDEWMRNEIYQKKVSNDQTRQVFNWLHDAGIAITAYYMLGGPGETRQSINKTINFSTELDGERSTFFVYKPFTQEGERLVYEHGGKINKEKWQRADNITFGSVVHTKELFPWMIEWYQCKAYCLTFSKRLLRIIKRQKLKYFVYLFRYMYRGLKDGLNYAYLITYFHVYGYDNVDK